ncbi:MAG: hypothetical protein PHN81_06150 [Actinomycetota bacterium]|nr:hypothetical protein [Actinomycetota bacterium]
MDSDFKDNKRKIPRHVDGRIKIGMLPLKNFFIFLPIAIAIGVFVFLNFTPLTLFVGAIFIGLVLGLLGEYQQRETGYMMIRDILRYTLSGDKYFERDTSYVKLHKRFIRNKI